jgi:DNA-binding response OmpR family regulator
MSPYAEPPRLLLVEDDPVSAAFLGEALSALPARVDHAIDIAQALQLARLQRHDLWLVDAHLPDGSGSECLAALRTLAATPALAITAGTAREQLDALCAHGFLEVLPKPLSIDLLQATVRRLLGGGNAEWVREPGGKLPIWDEAQALSAVGGDARALRALRVMFLDELPTQRRLLREARERGDLPAVAAGLHRMLAGCGFVGAARLRAAVERLVQSPLDDQAWTRFGFAADDALDGAAAQS